jgi:PAS domain S-box-containing protein
MDSFTLVTGFIIALGLVFSFFCGLWFKSNSTDSLKDQISKNSLNENFIDSISAAIIVRDSNSKITYCSPYVEVLTGYSTSEIINNQDDFFILICHEHEKERVYRSLKISELSGEPFQFVFQFYHKSGIDMWAESRIVPTFDDEGNITGTVSVVLDVTAMITHQKMVEEKNRELKEFTSMVSHDLKAPIYTINGLINVLKEDFAEEFPKSAVEIFSTIEKSGSRLEALIQSILDYARLGVKELKSESINLNELFKDVVAENHHYIDSKNAVIEIQETLPTIIGDSSALTQVFSNLLGNALKYSSSERTPNVKISAKNHTSPKHFSIEIVDNGLGIPNNRFDDIWKPFVRVHETEVEGTGIGLATVKKLVEKHGASISVKNNEDFGATFSVVIRGI